MQQLFNDHGCFMRDPSALISIYHRSEIYYNKAIPTYDPYGIVLPDKAKLIHGSQLKNLNS